MRRMAGVVLLFLLTAAGPPREDLPEVPQVRFSRTGWYHIRVDTTDWTVYEEPLDTVRVTDTFWISHKVEWGTCLLFGDTVYVEFFCPVLDTSGAVRDTLKCLDYYVTPVDSSGRVLEHYTDDPWSLPEVTYDTLPPWWGCLTGVINDVRLAVRELGALYFTDYARFPGTWFARARYVEGGVPAKQGLMQVAVQEDPLQVVDNYVDVRIVKNGQETLRVFGRDTLRIRYHENTFTWLRVELWEDSLPVRESAWVFTSLGHTSGWKDVALGVDFGEDIGVVYKVRVVAEDLFGNRAIDSVWVAVVPEITVTMSPNPVRPYVPARYNPLRDFPDAETLHVDVRITHPHTGQPIAYVPVRLRSRGIRATGGHAHDNAPLVGVWLVTSDLIRGTVDSAMQDGYGVYQAGTREVLRLDTIAIVWGRTDSLGTFHIPYRPAESAGKKIIEVSLGRDFRWSVVETLTVRYPGFVELVGPGIGYELVGETTTHPSNHWGRYYLHNFIRTLALFAHDSISGERLRINDMSLPWGGMFDICGNYHPQQPCPQGVGHEWHRTGEQVDFQGQRSDGLSLRPKKFQRLAQNVAHLLGLNLRRRTHRTRNQSRYHYHFTVVP